MKVRLNKQAGITGIFLLEMLTCMAIALSLAAHAGVSFVKAQAAHNYSLAKDRLRIVSRSIAVEQICLNTTGCAVSPALMAQIPNPGTIFTDGYLFTLTNNSGNWSYTATPAGQLGGGSIFVGPDGVLHCEPPGSMNPAGPTSRPCN